MRNPHAHQAGLGLSRPVVGGAAVALLLGPVLASCLRPPSQGPPSAANPAAATVPPAPAPRSTGALPVSLSWASTPPIVTPVSDAAHQLVAVKDPTVVRYNDRWHVYASSVARGGIYGMVYLSFADWREASKASRSEER